MNEANIHLAFDVGHSSIGWAVLQTGQELEIKGCGAVVFPADDCLASSRRSYRRQRRHIRATRQRIARIKAVLKFLGVLSDAELNGPGCAWPWKLAAQVLRGGELLTWRELWDVLRWYAHNRGYDGNRRWSTSEASEADQEDSEKEARARELMQTLGVNTMAETFCKVSGIDPLGAKKSCNVPGDKRPKGQNAAFPRETVEAEVRTILRKHCGTLKNCDADFERVLFSDWRVLSCPDLKLPKRYQGGLLFGQLVPRFDNRIISICPISGQKVPMRFCQEFLDLRWTLLLWNIKIGTGGSELRRLTAIERLAVDRACRARGFLRYDPDTVDKKTLQIQRGRNELRDILFEITGCDRHNLELLLFDQNMREALRILPIAGNADAFRIAWSAFSGPTYEGKTGDYVVDRLAGRFCTQLFRGKRNQPRKLSIRRIVADLERLNKSDIAARMWRATELAATKKGRMDGAKVSELLDAEFYLERMNGRARYSRKMMLRAFQEAMRRDNPLHPLEKGGCLEQTDEVLDALAKRSIDDLTNNPLVRHRLRILVGDLNAKTHPKSPEPKQGLLGDIIDEFASGSKTRISRITIELARDLQEMAGKDSKERKKIHNQKLDTHEDAARQLAEVMRCEGISFIEVDGRPRFSASLIRKARVALDLASREASAKLSSICPYTNRTYPLADVARGKMELDHIIPRSKRLSDALEAMVITFPSINNEKKNKTALQFIREMNQKGNEGKKGELGILSESAFLDFVNNLWPKSDPFKRAKATGIRPTDDEIRCWRRKQFLKTEKWEDDEFKPSDLAQTRHITKLAAQQIQRFFATLPKEERPPVIPLVGAVTKSFRDRTWKLLPLLQEREERSKDSAINAVFDRWQSELVAGREFNLKNELRSVTHLHHALDAITLALVSNMVVPPGHESMDGQLAQLIIKRKLNGDEKIRFEKLRHELGLSKFYCWASPLCGESQTGRAGEFKGGILCLEDLRNSLKSRIAECLAEKRVVQHLPADMSGMPTKETVWRIFDPNDVHKTSRRIKNWLIARKVHIPQATDPTVLITRRKRKGAKSDDESNGKVFHETGTWAWVYDEVVKTKVLGFSHVSKKLRKIKGGKLIEDNFGVALYPDAPRGEPKFRPIRFFKVWSEIQRLPKTSSGEAPLILRRGQMIKVERGRYAGKIWRVLGIEENGKIRFFAPDFTRRIDEPENYERVMVTSLLRDGLKIVRTPLTGVPCPTTSSA